jgi:septation ring formation regulator EzrA
MKHPTAQAQTRQLIADMRRMVDYLRIDIAREEDRSGVSNSTLPEYSTLARALSARRENLESTLASLEARLKS